MTVDTFAVLAANNAELKDFYEAGLTCRGVIDGRRFWLELAKARSKTALECWTRVGRDFPAGLDSSSDRASGRQLPSLSLSLREDQQSCSVSKAPPQRRIFTAK